MDPSTSKVHFLDAVTALGLSGSAITFIDLWVEVLGPLVHGIVLSLTVIILIPQAWRVIRLAFKKEKSPYPKMSEFTEPLE